MFIGEAPGWNEDQQGRPFVGAAGKLLEELLESIGLTREDVFIGNVVKARPPGNRDPKPEEIAHSWPWLRDQVAAIKPKVIVLLGRHAMDLFLPDLRISSVHGQAKRYRGQVYFPVYHPAAALYTGSLKQTLFDDFAKLPKILEKAKSLPEEEPAIEPLGPAAAILSAAESSDHHPAGAGKGSAGPDGSDDSVASKQAVKPPTLF